MIFMSNNLALAKLLCNKGAYEDQNCIDWKGKRVKE